MARPSLRNSRMYPIYVDEPDIAPAQMKSPGFSGMRNRSIVLAGIPVEEMTGGAIRCSTPCLFPESRRRLMPCWNPPVLS